jgi:Zn-finger nucleic acid-binding protein
MCPQCGEPLVTFELEGIETDHCVACGGTWLDAGELEEIAERSGGGAEKLREALKAAGESKHGARKCVRCSAKLTGVKFGTVDLDRCPYGHGLWFDKGEVVHVVNSNGGEVAGFLKDMFKAELKGD